MGFNDDKIGSCENLVTVYCIFEPHQHAMFKSQSQFFFVGKIGFTFSPTQHDIKNITNP